MDNFIEELLECISDLSDSEDLVAYNRAITMVESLGWHAKKMLQIGILQEELLRLGFDKQYYSLFTYSPQPKTCIDMQYVIEIDFGTAWTVTIRDNNSGEWHYSDTTNDWIIKVLDKVKQLIGDFNE